MSHQRFAVATLLGVGVGLAASLGIGHLAQAEPATYSRLRDVTAAEPAAPTAEIVRAVWVGATALNVRLALSGDHPGTVVILVWETAPNATPGSNPYNLVRLSEWRAPSPRRGVQTIQFQDLPRKAYRITLLSGRALFPATGYTAVAP